MIPFGGTIGLEGTLHGPDQHLNLSLSSLQEWRSLIPSSDKHSTFSTTFPIYINEKKTSQKALEADPDTEIEEDAEEQFETVTEDNWVRVNDKAPIWMRWVGTAFILQALTSS